MIDLPMTIEEQKAWLDEHKLPAERLEFLMQSKAVRLVLDCVYTPKDLDSAYQNLRKRVQQLEADNTANMVTIINQRRQIEMLCEVEK